jgi:hypothetical protein
MYDDVDNLLLFDDARRSVSIHSQRPRGVIVVVVTEPP